MDLKAGLTLGVVVVGLAVALVVIQTADQPVKVADPALVQAEPAVVRSVVPAEVVDADAAPAAVATTDPKSKFIHYRIGQRNVKSIYADTDNVVWVGTSGGVVRYDLNTDDYTHYDLRSGLLANGVFHVSRTRQGIAVGTYGGGLAILNEQTDEWKIYNVPEGLGDAFVYDLIEVANGDIWIATWTGVNRVIGGRLDDPDAWEVYTVANTATGVANQGLPNDWIYGLYEGKNNDVWMATEGGLAHFNYADASWQHWTHKDGLGVEYAQVKDSNPFQRDPADYSSHHARQKVEQGLTGVNSAYNPNYVVAITVDDLGRVWVGTWGAGLSRYDGKAWVTFTTADGLPANHVFMAEYDQQGLWIGTSHGMSLLDADGQVVRTFTTEDGLYANSVFSMARDQSGAFWVGSFGGIARIAELH
ncbi:MAG: two-component regulator propeller domain-containing protein [Motiliproteus sp.]